MHPFFRRTLSQRFREKEEMRKRSVTQINEVLKYMFVYIYICIFEDQDTYIHIQI